MNLPAKQGLELYIKALEQEQDKRNWDIFIHTNHDKPISFDDWKKQQAKQYKADLNKVSKTIVIDEKRIQDILNKDRCNQK